MPKPRIFLIVSGRWGDNVSGCALAEDGHVLASHVSSHTGFLRHDLGLTGNWKHDQYDAHYPESWELVDLIDVSDLSTVPAYMAALAKNRELEVAAANAGTTAPGQEAAAPR